MEVDSVAKGDGFRPYYITKIEELQLVVADKSQNLRRLQAQRNELNAKGSDILNSYSVYNLCKKNHTCSSFRWHKSISSILKHCLFSVRMLREELQLLQEQGSYVGEVVKPMDKKKVLVKVHPEGKFVVDLDKNIDINDVTANCRVALRNESYTLHKILPNKVIIFIFQFLTIILLQWLFSFSLFLRLTLRHNLLFNNKNIMIHT